MKLLTGVAVLLVALWCGSVAEAASTPPPAAGYFTLQPVGATTSLPNDQQCANMVHQSTWEPRPLNTKRNNTLVNVADAHASLAARHYDSSYDPRWNTWLLPRVDGQFTGTTDEIFQWAACKWGLPDNVLRGIAVRESTWYQFLTYSKTNNMCWHDWSCGDYFTKSTTASKVFCSYISTFGHNYQADYGQGLCPKTFSITGIMSWQDPSWGKFPNNSNGTFPFTRDSTAFAEDYIGSYLRGCYNGWIKWLGPSGDLWGCVGSWYSGDWHSSDANGYISRVQNEINNHTWLQPGWPNDKPACVKLGCPVADTLP